MKPRLPIDPDTARRWMGQMLLIRRFEEKSAERYMTGDIRGFLHLYIGEEAVAVGAMNALRPEDWIVSHYREHGHAIARGMSPRVIMAEMFGKVTGCSRGRGGSMHLFDRSLRFLGGFAIVGSVLPIAVGCALGDRYTKREGITAVLFGDGAVAEGAFHEAMNLASLWSLPVLFLCENNLYAMGTAFKRHQAQQDLVLKASGYGIPGHSVDGMDVVAVAEAARDVADLVRKEGTPRLLEFRTYRFRAHSMYDPDLYRDKAEVARWRTRDPLTLFAAWAKDEHLLDDDAIRALEEDAREAVDDAVAFAEASELEPVEELTRFVSSEGRPS